jgi:hypothetical protein
MSKKVIGLEQSWKTFLSAQKVLSTLTGARTSLAAETPSTLVSELPPVPVLSKSPVPHHGGLLNNLNDPSKFPKRDYSFKPRKSAPKPPAISTAGDVTCSEEPNDAPLICRSLSRPGTHFFTTEAKQRISCSASRVELSQGIQSIGELAVVLKKLALKTRIPQLKRRQSRPSTSSLRSRDKSFVSKGLDTTDPDHISTSPVHTRNEKDLQASYQLDSLPSTAPTSKNRGKRTLISKYLDHMLREQAHRRTVMRQTRLRAGCKAGIVRGKSKHSEAFRALTGLETWEEFEEVLVGEKAAVAKITSRRCKKANPD